MNFDLGPSFMDEVLKALNSSSNGDSSSPPLKTPTTVSFAFPKSPPPPPGVPPPDTPTPTNSVAGGGGGSAETSSASVSDPDSVSVAPSEISFADAHISDSEPLLHSQRGGSRGGRKFVSEIRETVSHKTERQDSDVLYSVHYKT